MFCNNCSFATMSRMNVPAGIYRSPWQPAHRSACSGPLWQCHPTPSRMGRSVVLQETCCEACGHMSRAGGQGPPSVHANWWLKPASDGDRPAHKASIHLQLTRRPPVPSQLCCLPAPGIPADLAGGGQQQRTARRRGKPCSALSSGKAEHTRCDTRLSKLWLEHAPRHTKATPFSLPTSPSECDCW